jgi:nucleoside 2-deoxyribosyltransferase
MHPKWGEVFGSGGRATSAIMRIGGNATLHTYLTPQTKEIITSRSAIEGFSLSHVDITDGGSFSYHHTLSTPSIIAPSNSHPPISVAEEKVIRFGIIEGDAIIHADYAVYDPQDAYSPKHFRDNGSTAKHLAIVLNRHEASILCNLPNTSPEDLAKVISSNAKAEVVIIKMGAKGALVLENGIATEIPAFETNRVWKIGSGDTFVGVFGYFWMEEKRPATEAALLASKATAYYCTNQGFPSLKHLSACNFPEVKLSERYLNGYAPLVYLAGPFFTLAELWLIDQARTNLREMGLRVFSPYHDVGHGSADDVVELDLKAIRECDAIYAIADSMDSGTIFEVGYARALGKPVVFYSENESDGNKKMMEGSNCILCDDYVTSIYKMLWSVASL